MSIFQFRNCHSKICLSSCWHFKLWTLKFHYLIDVFIIVCHTWGSVLMSCSMLSEVFRAPPSMISKAMLMSMLQWGPPTVSHVRDSESSWHGQMFHFFSWQIKHQSIKIFQLEEKHKQQTYRVLMYAYPCVFCARLIMNKLRARWQSPICLRVTVLSRLHLHSLSHTSCSSFAQRMRIRVNYSCKGGLERVLVSICFADTCWCIYYKSN